MTTNQVSSLLYLRELYIEIETPFDFHIIVPLILPTFELFDTLSFLARIAPFSLQSTTWSILGSLNPDVLLPHVFFFPFMVRS